MRGFIRSLSAVLLIVILSTFLLWRYEKLDAIANLTAYFDDSLSRFEQLLSLVRPKEDADDTGPSGPYDPEADYANYQPTQEINASLEAALRTGLANLDARIYLNDVSPSPTSSEVKAAMAAIIYSSPEFFYLQSSYGISALDNGVVQYITPSYLSTDASEIAAMRSTYEAVLDEIEAGAPQTGSDFDKILYLHDYFVENYAYDEDLVIRDAYHFFTQKKGVCQAYMLALIAAAQRLDIESLPVTSDVMKHAWNLVKIDGAWYHVDITWDDSRSLPTLTSYTYFLQSDAGLSAIDAGRAEQNRHRDWAAATEATSTKYDAAVFRASNTPMIVHNGMYYCTVKASNAAGNVRGIIYAGSDVVEMSELRKITGGYWTAKNGYFYTDCYAGLAVAGNYLYYHSGNTICRASLTDASDYNVYLVTGLSSGECIYGFFGVEDGVLSYLISNTLETSGYRIGTFTIP